jgi:lysophospholipase L1-like esterase
MLTTEAKPEVSKTPQPRRMSWRRRWAFRMAAIVLGLAPFVAFEGLCAVFDWGRPGLHDDPFVGFRSIVPLFVLSEDGTRYEIPKSRQAYFCYDSFAAQKPANEFRIFCLGESTVQGNPFTIETAFTTWLEIALAAADPSRRWEVVNCGGISYASYRLVPVLEEVLRYEPDLVMLCVGHNEFLEDRAYESIARRGRVLNAALERAARLRTFALVREGFLRVRGRPEAAESRPVLPTEVDALLDYRGGLEEYHRDEAWHEGVIAHYRYNVRRMVEMARAAGVEMILMNPVSNYCDSPPFKSEHRADLSKEELAEWDAIVEEGHRHLRRGNYDLVRAIELFERATRLDPLHAGGFYNLAKAYQAAGRIDEAREAYRKAKDLDVCPLRILQPMNDAVFEIARETGTPLLDVHELFEERSEDKIVGGDWLVDHVHPSIEGHQLLADVLAELLIAQGKVRPREGWQEEKKRRYREHFESLDNLYFMRGMARLSALRNWAQGRAQRLRPSGAEGEPAS